MLLLLPVGVAATQSLLQPGGYLSVSGLRDVGGREFHSSELTPHALLIFSSSRETADQSRRWGDAVAKRYRERVGTWDAKPQPPLLVVPVLDLSGMPWIVPKGLIPSMVKLLGGGDNVLLDWKGALNKTIGSPTPQAAVVLVGPDSKVRALTVGDYSPSAAGPLFAAIDAQIARQAPPAPSGPVS